MKVLVLIGATVQAVLALVLMIIAPYLGATNLEVTAIKANQVVYLAVAVLAIVFVVIKKWHALFWLGAIGVGYTLVGMGWRIGQGQLASVVLADAAFSAWYVACMLLGRQRRRASVPTPH